MGTRFLASKEAPISDEWKPAIVSARSEEAVKIELLDDIQPLPGTAGYGTVSRSIRTPFIDQWATRRDAVRQQSELLLREIQAKSQAGRRHEVIVTSGQTCGSIKEILSVGEIILKLTAEAAVALTFAAGMMSGQN